MIERSAHLAVDLARVDIQGVDYKQAFRAMAEPYGDWASMFYQMLMARAAVIHRLEMDDTTPVIPAHAGSDIDASNVALGFVRHPRLGWACTLDSASVDHIIRNKMWCWPVFIVTEYDYVVFEGGFHWSVLEECNEEPPVGTTKDPVSVRQALREEPAEPWLRRRWVEGTSPLDPFRVSLALHTDQLDVFGALRPAGRYDDDAFEAAV